MSYVSSIIIYCMVGATIAQGSMNNGVHKSCSMLTLVECKYLSVDKRHSHLLSPIGNKISTSLSNTYVLYVSNCVIDKITIICMPYAHEMCVSVTKCPMLDFNLCQLDYPALV